MIQTNEEEERKAKTKHNEKQTPSAQEERLHVQSFLLGHLEVSSQLYQCKLRVTSISWCASNFTLE